MSPRLDSRWGGSSPFPGREFRPLEAPGLAWRTEELCEDYEPVAIVQESLVQTIPTCLWRKARVIRAENGEIRKRLDTLAVDRALRNSDEGNLGLALSEMEFGLYNAENQTDQKASTRDRWSAMQGAQGNLRGYRSRLAYRSALLKTVKCEIASDGYTSEKSRKKIFFAFRFWDYYFALTCLYAGPPEAKMEDRPSERVVDKQKVIKNAPMSSPLLTIGWKG